MKKSKKPVKVEAVVKEPLLEPVKPVEPVMASTSWISRIVADVMIGYTQRTKVEKFPPRFRFDHLQQSVEKLISCSDSYREELTKWKVGMPPPEMGELRELNELMREKAGICHQSISGRSFCATITPELLTERILQFMDDGENQILDMQNHKFGEVMEECVLEYKGKKYDFGPMELWVNYQNIWNPIASWANIIVVKPRIPVMDSSHYYFHPHVNKKGELCSGEHKTTVWNSLRSFELVESFRMIRAIMSDYVEKHAFRKIGMWSKELEEANAAQGRVCGFCGKREIDGAVMYNCEVPDPAEGGYCQRGKICAECVGERGERPGRCKNCNKIICSYHSYECAECGFNFCNECSSADENNDCFYCESCDERL